MTRLNAQFWLAALAVVCDALMVAILIVFPERLTTETKEVISGAIGGITTLAGVAYHSIFAGNGDGGHLAPLVPTTTLETKS